MKKLHSYAMLGLWSWTVLGLCSNAVLYAEVKIGYINSNRILDEYKGRDKLKTKLEKELAKWENEALQKKQKIENLIKEFESQSLMLSEEARLRKRREIEESQAEYEKFIQKVWGQDGLAKRQNDEIMKPFIEKVNLILQKIGKDREYTIILDAASSGIVYVKEGMDLTDEVIAELNKEFAPTLPIGEKTYFWVFKFKELTPEAREWNLGVDISKQYVRAAFIKSDRFKETPSGKFQDALREANINKPDESEWTIEEVAKVGRIAGAGIVVIGEVTKVGDKVDITCKVVDPLTEMVIAEEIGSSQGAEREDINNMVQEVVAKLLPKISK